MSPSARRTRCGLDADLDLERDHVGAGLRRTAQLSSGSAIIRWTSLSRLGPRAADDRRAHGEHRAEDAVHDVRVDHDHPGAPRRRSSSSRCPRSAVRIPTERCGAPPRRRAEVGIGSHGGAQAGTDAADSRRSCSYSSSACAGIFLVDDRAARPGASRRRVALEDVPAHVHAGRALLDGAVRHRSASSSGSFLPPAMTIGTGQEALTVSKPSGT